MTEDGEEKREPSEDDGNRGIENAVLLKNGCICCTVRGDILATIDEFFRRREAGELPWFGRIALETSQRERPHGGERQRNQVLVSKIAFRASFAASRSSKGTVLSANS